MDLVQAEPIEVDVKRGGFVESSHRVLAVVYQDDTIRSWGDPNKLIMPRSAAKLMQAMPLITSGAADKFNFSLTDLALACASHSGEKAHVDAVDRMLERLGLSGDDLECGPDEPLGVEERRIFLSEGRERSRLLNCCSGKHAGFLAVARLSGVDHRGYIDPHHAVQRHVTAAIETLADTAVSANQPGIDGCSAPMYPMPIASLARAMWTLVTGTGLTDAQAIAAVRIVEAVDTHPFWVSGAGRDEVKFRDRSNPRLVSKVGAEGVFVAGLPDQRVGVACKAVDGSERAAVAAVEALLVSLDALEAEPRPLRNKAKQIVGSIETRL